MNGIAWESALAMTRRQRIAAIKVINRLNKPE
jgi:hypothetical protein